MQSGKEYKVKEMMLTLQGEGALTGTAVVLLRFAGCNLSCDFCDTDFTGTDGSGGGVFRTAEKLAEAVQAMWLCPQEQISVLCTGGEPLLQLDTFLVEEFHKKGFRILIETNGTQVCPDGIDWICVSPKSGRMPVQATGDEIKIVWPQQNTDPVVFEKLNFRHFWIQPMYNSSYRQNIQKAVQYCLEHPRWRLSLQTHRFIGIP